MKNDKHVKKEYDRLAPDYDTRWEGYLKSTHQVALRLADLSSGDLLLDASGGTGLLAEQAMGSIGEQGNIVLTDISYGMLNIAKQRMGAYPNVQIMQNDVHDLQFEGDSFTKVLSVSALHYYAEPEKAISEFHRVLKPDGSLVVIDWCRDQFHFKMFDWMMRRVNRPHVRIHTSEELRHMILKEGFKIDDVIKWSHGMWSLMGIKAKKG